MRDLRFVFGLRAECEREKDKEREAVSITVTFCTLPRAIYRVYRVEKRRAGNLDLLPGDTGRSLRCVLIQVLEGYNWDSII